MTASLLGMEKLLKVRSNKKMVEQDSLRKHERLSGKNNISYSSIDVQLGKIYCIRKKEEASVALKNVFGITSLSPAIRMETDFEKSSISAWRFQIIKVKSL